MIEDIEFRDADGYLEVRIDNERHYLDIKEIVRKETEIIALKSFDQVLSGVSVVSDLQRIDLVYVHKIRHPLETVFVIHEVLSG